MWYADLSGRAVYGMNCLHYLEHLDRGIESHSRYECLHIFVLFILPWVSNGLATGWTPVQEFLLAVLGFRIWSEINGFTDAKSQYNGLVVARSKM
jgi:hypothetical protein